jgi:hypothetical protein
MEARRPEEPGHGATKEHVVERDRPCRNGPGFDEREPLGVAVLDCCDDDLHCKFLPP